MNSNILILVTPYNDDLFIGYVSDGGNLEFGWRKKRLSAVPIDSDPPPSFLLEGSNSGEEPA
jgi:hypothetical protein